MSINFQNIQIIQMFSDYNEIKFKINNSNIFGKFPHIWNLNNTHTMGQNRNNFELNNNEDNVSELVEISLNSQSVSSLAQLCPTLCNPMNDSMPASLSITNSWSLPKPMSIESVMPSNHVILCCPLLLLPSIFPSIRGFSNESALHIRWPKYWSFSFSISPSMNSQDWSPLGWNGWISLQSKGLSRVFSNTTVQKHQFFSAQLSSQSNSHIHIWPLEKP